MSRLWTRFAELFRRKDIAGVDKVGNKYFSRTEEVDGLMKERRWVVFKGEEDPTSIPVEWICWLNGQRKRAPTLEEMAELEARRERVKQNIALLKKEEEEKKVREGSARNVLNSKGTGPDLKSFIRQFPDASEGGKPEEASGGDDDTRRKQAGAEKVEQPSESSEPTGSGSSFRPGTWQPPT